MFDRVRLEPVVPTLTHCTVMLPALALLLQLPATIGYTVGVVDAVIVFITPVAPVQPVSLSRQVTEAVVVCRAYAVPLPQQAAVVRVDAVLLLKQAPPEPALAVRLTLKLLGKVATPDLLHVTVTLAGDVTAHDMGG